MDTPQFALLTGGAALALAAIMAAAWMVQQKTGNSGWIDTTWSFAVGAVAAAAALVPLQATSAPYWRQWLVGGLAATWSLRLGSHIAMRTLLSSDDPRYRKMVKQWGTAAPRRMFWFLQSQAVVGIALAMSVVLAARNPDPAFRIQDLAGVLIAIAAIIGETIADAQLRRFKSDPTNRNGICDLGLWRWSRHPNYFFEWLTWMSYPIIAISVSRPYPWGLLALSAPALMYWILVHVSGIPPLEEHMLQSRGSAFVYYRRRTRAFLPLPFISSTPRKEE